LPTELSALRLRLSQGAALQAEPLVMRSKALPFLRVVSRHEQSYNIVQRRQMFTQEGHITEALSP